MGTPEFAVPTLLALHRSGYRIPVVVTQPDRPKGRGRKTHPPPVKTEAIALGIEVEQPQAIRSGNIIAKLKELEPDLFVVVALGHILSRELLNIPKMGAINVHASLLPKYRGAAPIQWAIINGDKQTGVTTIQMDTGMDTGDILLSSRAGISDEDTSQSLHDRLSVMGADLLIKTIKGLIAGTITPMAQDHTIATRAPMLKKSDGRIDWNKPAAAIDAFIRGMSPWPGAFTFLGDKRIKIFSAKPAQLTSPSSPGTVIRGFSNELRVATGDQALTVLELQGASGKRLPINSFLIGNPISKGAVFR